MPLGKNVLINMPHILIFIAAFGIASMVGRPAKEA
jgi:hypothetical protein